MPITVYVIENERLFLFAVAGVDPRFASLTSSGNYIRLAAPTASVTTTVLSTASPMTSQPIASTRPTVGAWHSRSSLVRTAASSSSVASQSPVQHMYYCRVCMISCAGAQVCKTCIIKCSTCCAADVFLAFFYPAATCLEISYREL